jgi:hypothetical protein
MFRRILGIIFRILGVLIGLAFIVVGLLPFTEIAAAQLAAWHLAALHVVPFHSDPALRNPEWGICFCIGILGLMLFIASVTPSSKRKTDNRSNQPSPGIDDGGRQQA